MLHPQGKDKEGQSILSSEYTLVLPSGKEFGKEL